MAKKYVIQKGRNMTKHKSITLSDGQKVKLYALGHKTAKGNLRCSNVAAETYISGFNWREIFDLNTYDSPEKKLDTHFKKIKRRIEDSNKDIIVVLTYGTSVTNSKNNGVLIEVALHIPEMEFNTSTLDDQRILIWLTERTIEEVRNSFK